jgi:CelD/BcsL family acetyltransferase involved in cellulose biosynthesis
MRGDRAISAREPADETGVGQGCAWSTERTPLQEGFFHCDEIEEPPAVKRCYAVLGTHLIDPIADPDWLAFVESSPSAEIFHHPRWLELLRAQYGYEFQACCVANGRGIEAGLPIARIKSRLTGRRLVSLPFSDVCSPALAADAGPGALDGLSLALAEEVKKTGLGLTVHAALPNAPEAFVQPRFFRHLLSLSADPAEVEARISKSQLGAAKKAKREGLRGERRTDVAALDAFYALHLKTRRRLGVPTQPKRFIRRFEQLFDEGLGFVWIVLDGDQPIAAAVFLTYNGTVTYKYSASATAALKKRPNNLLLCEAIRWSCEAGFDTFDFGRTDSDNEGLRKFKRSWGAEEHELSYTYLTDSEPALDVAPTMSSRLISATIQRSPAVVGRLAGEALYRHVG